MYRQAALGTIFLCITVGLFGSVAFSSDNHSSGNYTVENFNPGYSTVNSTGYTVYIEENVSSVPLMSKVLYLVEEEDKYNRLDSIMFQFGDPNLDGGPKQDWTPSLNWRVRNAIEEYDYIKYKRHYYDLSYEEPEELSEEEIVFNAQLKDKEVTPGDPAEMQLELKINSDRNVSISTGAPYPFKTLYAASEDERICIWSEEYVKSDHVSGYCEGGGVHAIGLRKTHTPGEVIMRNYSIRAQDVNESGSYVMEEDLEYYNGSMEKTLNYRIGFELETN